MVIEDAHWADEATLDLMTVPGAPRGGDHRDPARDVPQRRGRTRPARRHGTAAARAGVPHRPGAPVPRGGRRAGAPRRPGRRRDPPRHGRQPVLRDRGPGGGAGRGGAPHRARRGAGPGGAPRAGRAGGGRAGLRGAGARRAVAGRGRDRALARGSRSVPGRRDAGERRRGGAVPSRDRAVQRRGGAVAPAPARAGAVRAGGAARPRGRHLARVVHHARRAADRAVVLAHAPAAARAASAAGRTCRRPSTTAPRWPWPRGRAGGARRAAGGALVRDLPGGPPEEALSTRQDALAIRTRLGQTARVGEDERWLSRILWWLGGARSRRPRRDAPSTSSSPSARRPSSPWPTAGCPSS